MEHINFEDEISVAKAVKKNDDRLYRTIVLAPIFIKVVFALFGAISALVWGYFTIKHDIKEAKDLESSDVKDIREVESRHYKTVQQIFVTVHPGQEPPPP